MSTQEIRDRFVPWAGLALGTVGYFIGHQLGSDATFQDCRVGSPLIVTIAMLIGVAMSALGGFWSYGIFRRQEEMPSRRVISAISIGAAALFIMAIVLPFIAALIIPRCWA